MVIDILTIFPSMVKPALSESLLGKAIEESLIEINVVDIRSFTEDRHQVVDDAPFGGGPGMVMKVEPLYAAIKSRTELSTAGKPRILLTSASGKTFNQKIAEELSGETHIIIVCGRYKGIDERIQKLFDIEEISIGDYVLSGGEFPALVMTEAIARLLPGYMGKFEAAETDSFTSGLLGYPEYTRPQEFMGLAVPEVLISGHHKNIREFRRTKAIEKTLKNRPDLLEIAELTEEDRAIIDRLKRKKENSSIEGDAP